MPSSNRLVVGLSSYLVPALLGVLLAGCPDPGGEFDDFVNKIPDAPVTIEIDAPPVEVIPDVSGTFLIGLTNTLLTQPIQFLATQTVDMTGGGYRVTLSFQPLHKVTRLPVGSPAVFGPVDVSDTAQFTANLPGTLTIPAEANTLIDLPIVANTVVIAGRILSTDLHCGTLDGNVTAPVVIDLSEAVTTYAGIRVPPGTMGTALPPPQVKCP
jgi:hypothetical protein